MNKTILAISGSLRQGSTNTQLLRLIGGWLPDGFTWNEYNGLGDLPHFSPVSEGEHYPAAVQDLHRQLSQVDAVIICTPEYAFGVPGSLKNLLDWTVATGNFVGKPTAVITASSQGTYAHPALLTTLGALSASLVNGGDLLIQFVRSKMDSDGNITDEALEKDLRFVLGSLLKAIA